MTLTVLGIVAILLILPERLPQLRFCSSPIFRRFFFTDMIYLSTGFIIGGAAAAAYVDYGSRMVGATLGMTRLTLALPRWASILLALVMLDAGNYLAHYLLHRFDT